MEDCKSIQQAQLRYSMESIQRSASEHGTGLLPDQNQPSLSTNSASNSQNANSSSAPVAAKIRRRNRLITSCLECRRRKLKCDKTNPCINCTKFGRECIFMSKEDVASQSRLLELKEKVGSLERQLGKGIATSSSPSLDTELRSQAETAEVDDDLSEPEDEKGLEPSPLATHDAVYGDDGQDDELLDLGIQVGRMRITERIGGFFRPKIAEELAASFRTGDARLDSTATKFEFNQPQTLYAQNLDFLKPGPSYIAPASGVLFGQSKSQEGWQTYLPAQQTSNRLIRQYFEAVHPIARCVHRPSFEQDYEIFWQHVAYNVEPLASLQVVVFAAMFSAAVSMDEKDILQEFGISKESLVENFKKGVETALTRANVLRTTKIATLQGFVMYLIPLCREELSRAHSVLVGAAIRLAECMGLHKDGEAYALNPVETHVRRLVWHQLCFLDLRTCEAQGPRPSIRREEYDTKLPLNIDDIELQPGRAVQPTSDRWTDCTFSLIRFEIDELFRIIWVERPRIEKRQTSLTALLAKIETAKKRMSKKYDHLFDDNIPLHKAAKTMKALLLGRTHVMVLHRYHNSVASKMPPRLREMMVRSSLQSMECGIALEVLPELSPWKWYVGAYLQYHSAFLLLVDVAIYGQDLEIDRVWACLNYVFKTDRNTSREERSQAILREIWEKTTFYNQKRKMKAPSSLRMENLRATFQKEAPDKAPIYHKSGTQNEVLHTLNVSQRAIDQSMLSQPSTSTPYPGQMYVQNTGSSAQSLSPFSLHTSSPPAPPQVSPSSQLSQDALMADIDWDAFDALFPPDQVIADFYAYDFPVPDFPDMFADQTLSGFP